MPGNHEWGLGGEFVTHDRAHDVGILSFKLPCMTLAYVMQERRVQAGRIG